MPYRTYRPAKSPGTIEATDTIYVAMNMHWETTSFGLPSPPPGHGWHVFLNTAMPTPGDIWEPGSEPPVGDPRYILATGRSVIVLVAKMMRR